MLERNFLRHPRVWWVAQTIINLHLQQVENSHVLEWKNKTVTYIYNSKDQKINQNKVSQKNICKVNQSRVTWSQTSMKDCETVFASENLTLWDEVIHINEMIFALNAMIK